MKHFPNLVTVEGFDASDLCANYIQYEHPLAGFERYVAVAGTVTAFGTRLTIEGRTEIIATAATINDGQSTYLNRECRLLFQKKSFQFCGKCWQYVDQACWHGTKFKPSPGPLLPKSPCSSVPSVVK